MKHTILPQKTLAVVLLIIVATCSPIVAGDSVSSAEFTESHYLRLFTTGTNEGDLSYVWWDNIDVVGKGGPSTSRQHRSGVHGFALPTLTDDVMEATYTLAKTGSNTDASNPGWDWSAQIYLFNPEINPRSYAAEHGVETVFWSDHEEDNRGLVRTIDLNAFNKNTPNGALSFTLTDELLAGFYNENGTPASEGGMIWFRVNPGEKEPNIFGTERLEIQSSIGQANSPTLSVTQIPEPRTYALFGGIAALLLVVVRRQIRRS